MAKISRAALNRLDHSDQRQQLEFVSDFRKVLVKYRWSIELSNELHAHDSTGKTLYAVLLSSVGTVWNGSAWVTINGANWTQ